MKKPNKKQLQDEWIKTLESGTYKQTKGKLHHVRGNQHSFCCLGVACEVYKKYYSLKEDKREDTIVYEDHSSLFLPFVVQKKFGFSSNDGLIDDQKSLSLLNDKGKNFKAIAKIVKENRKKVFK
jgi:hypothetical protein